MNRRKLVGLAVCVMLLVGMFGFLAGQIKPVYATGSILRVQGNARGTTTGINITVTMVAAPTSGNSLIAAIGTRGNGGAVSISSISQTGVTWSQAVDTTSGWQDLAIWLGAVSAGASASLNVTLSGNAANGGVADVCEYSGISSSPVDKTATNSSAGPFIDTGTTATTTQANELWIGATFDEGGVSPPYHAWNPTNGFIMFDGAGYQQVNVAYLEKFVTSTGAANSGITGDSASGLLGCIATFKLDGAPTGIVRVQGPARGTSITINVTVTMGAAPTSGNVLIATISSSMFPSGPSTVSSISETGVTWTKQANNAYNSEWDAEIWYGVVGAGASSSLNVTMSAAPNYGAIADVCEYSGLNTTTFLDKTATNGGSSTTTDTGTTATTTQASELWIGVITTNGKDQTAPTNAFGQFDGSDYTNVGSAYLEKIVNSTGTANSGTTPLSSAYYSGCIATFKAAAVAGDTTAPTYSNPNTNSTVAGYPCNFSVTLADNVALTNYTFGTNSTGPWVNDSAVNISGSSYLANTTKTLNSTVGVVVQWEYWFADSSNNLNNTGIKTLTTTAEYVTVTLNSPSNGYSQYSRAISFVYTPVCVGDTIQNTTLWTNVTGSWAATQGNTTAVANNTQNTIGYTFNSNGTYLWNVQVYNSSMSTFASSNYTLTLLYASLIVTLNSPSNSTSQTSLSATLTYTPICVGDTIQNASLWVNASGTWQNVQNNQTAVANNTANSFSYTFPAYGMYVWNVKVYNTTAGVFASANYTLTLDPTLTISSGTGGATNPVAGTYTNYTSGATVAIYETNSSGYDWSNWLVNGSSGGSSNPLTFTITGNTTAQPVFSLTSVTVTITNPTNTTYTSDTIPVQFSASGGTIDQEWFNCKNGTAWIYASNESYTAGIMYLAGFVDGSSYTFYDFANNTVGTVGQATVMFSVSISAPSGPSGPSGPSSGGLNIQVSDCSVSVAPGGSATALIPVSWASPTNVFLTQITFQGAGADWLTGPVLPLTLGSGNTIQVGVTVPSSVADGNYSVQVSSQFTFQSGIQTVVSHVNIQVGATSGLGGFDVQGWITAHLELVLISVAVLVGVVCLAVVAVRRRKH